MPARPNFLLSQQSTSWISSFYQKSLLWKLWKPWRTKSYITAQAAQSHFFQRQPSVLLENHAEGHYCKRQENTLRHSEYSQIHKCYTVMWFLLSYLNELSKVNSLWSVFVSLQWDPDIMSTCKIMFPKSWVTMMSQWLGKTLSDIKLNNVCYSLRTVMRWLLWECTYD